MELDAGLGALCDRCLGRRLVGARGLDVQQEAARAERQQAGWPDVAEADCPVCEGAFADLERWEDLAVAALEPYQFATFQPGTLFPVELEAREKALMRLVPGENTESLRTEANRLLAPRVAQRIGAEAVTEGRPDVVVQVDTRFWSAEARANSLFLAGRYTKFRRDLPQTHWPCRLCQGRGCWQCGDTGVQYAESVEEEIAGHAEPVFGASGSSFHGAGREDIDALMLGSGRPFVLELHDPKRRKADLADLERRVNARTDTSGVGVQGLRLTDRDEVVALKAAGHDKVYLARCETDTDVLQEQVEAACRALSGAMLEQRTPRRVAHRRADLVRLRKVHELTLERFEDPRHFDLRVHAGSGTYIKEMVHGDEGRTVPSFAGVLGVPCRVVFLDVLEIREKVPE